MKARLFATALAGWAVLCSATSAQGQQIATSGSSSGADALRFDEHKGLFIHESVGLSHLNVSFSQGENHRDLYGLGVIFAGSAGARFAKDWVVFAEGGGIRVSQPDDVLDGMHLRNDGQVSYLAFGPGLGYDVRPLGISVSAGLDVIKVKVDAQVFDPLPRSSDWGWGWHVAAGKECPISKHGGFGASLRYDDGKLSYDDGAKGTGRMHVNALSLLFAFTYHWWPKAK